MHQEIENWLDILSLLALGGTCDYFSDRVSHTLKKERNAIIGEYLCALEQFLWHLTDNKAVITGEAALAFIMRDWRILTNELEISVPGETSYELLGLFDNNWRFEHAWTEENWPQREENRPTVYLYRTPGSSNRLIRVICSHTSSAFTPITTYPTTTLFNYMDAFSFGCAYRDLTISRKALTPDLPHLPLDVKAQVDTINSKGGFKQRYWPDAPAIPPATRILLKETFGCGDDPLPAWASTVCRRQDFLCPGQSRSFGDPGSLLDFFEPDLVDHGVMAHHNIPPYGATAVWRMESPDCNRACASGDYVLPGPLLDALLRGH